MGDVVGGLVRRDLGRAAARSAPRRTSGSGVRWQSSERCSGTSRTTRRIASARRSRAIAERGTRAVKPWTTSRRSPIRRRRGPRLARVGALAGLGADDDGDVGRACVRGLGTEQPEHEDEGEEWTHDRAGHVRHIGGSTRTFSPLAKISFRCPRSRADERTAAGRGPAAIGQRGPTPVSPAGGEPAVERRAEGLAHRALLEALDQLGHEALDHEPRRGALVQPARAQVEELLLVDLRDGRGVGAADVVGEDLEARDRVGVRLLGEQQVAALLERVRLLGARVDLDHPAPHRAGAVGEDAAEGEVRRRVRRPVLLRRVEVDVLARVRRVGARHLRVGARAGEQRLRAHLAARGAEAEHDPVERAVALHLGALGAEDPRALVELLGVDVAQVRVLADLELDHRVEHGRLVAAGQVLLPDLGLGALLEHDQHAAVQDRAGGAADDGEQDRRLDAHAARDVDERAALPARLVGGREGVERRGRRCRGAARRARGGARAPRSAAARGRRRPARRPRRSAPSTCTSSAEPSGGSSTRPAS